MSDFRLSVQLVGEYDLLEALVPHLDGLTYELRREGQRLGLHGVQPTNVLLIHLTGWTQSGAYPDEDQDALLALEDARLVEATTLLQRLAPALASLDRSRVNAVLWLSVINMEEQGGLDLPTELIAAAAAASLGLAISTLVVLPPDEEEPDHADLEPGRGA